MIMSTMVNCETCANYIYDEEFEEYYCQMNLDEDEYGRLISSSEYKSDVGLKLQMSVLQVRKRI